MVAQWHRVSWLWHKLQLCSCSALKSTCKWDVLSPGLENSCQLDEIQTPSISAVSRQAWLAERLGHCFAWVKASGDTLLSVPLQMVSVIRLGFGFSLACWGKICVITVHRLLLLFKISLEAKPRKEELKIISLPTTQFVRFV